MDTHEVNHTIDILIRAGRSIIGITSNDEYRVMRGLDAVCHLDKQRHPISGDPKQIYQWDVFAGFQTWREGDELPEALGIKQGKSTMPITRPEEAIKVLINFPPQEEAIFVLKGMEALLGNNPVIVRGLRNLNMALKNRQQSVILLSPTLQLPAGLDTEVSVIDYPLPGVGEISSALEAVSSKNGVKVQFNEEQDRQALVNALRGLELEDIMVTLHQSLVKHTGAINTDTIGLVLEEKQQIVRKSGVLEYIKSSETMDDIGGLVNLKSYLQEVELTFTDQARERCADVARGVLIAGIPGTGKSLAAKACASGRHPKPLLRMSMSELMAQGGGIVGRGQAMLHRALKVVESASPCVLWIDEVEKSLGRRSGELDGGTRSDMAADLLTWMQENTAPVFIVATANDAQALPVELVRRFDEIFFVDTPGPRARLEIFTLHLEKRNQNIADFDADQLVSRSQGYTGAEIEKAVKRAIRKALVREFEGQAFVVATEDILTSLDEIKPISITMKDQIEYYRQWDGRNADSDDPETEDRQAVKDIESETTVRW